MGDFFFQNQCAGYVSFFNFSVWEGVSHQVLRCNSTLSLFILATYICVKLQYKPKAVALHLNQILALCAYFMHNLCAQQKKSLYIFVYVNQAPMMVVQNTLL